MNGYCDTLRVFLDVGVDASPPTGFHFEVHERLTEVEEKDEFEKEDDEDERQTGGE
ncbi:hypothetical protein PENSUB_5241 [Penicillium subrubescens]|uniref:Uncharacterized protein n=1 Tax=Penicillium subrubescens TaxID=1316194 RepID=A0A1Q5UAC8_9EURO|nr:hypothetical protein PENSUB_5241 [Penicillium subrubescens]